LGSVRRYPRARRVGLELAVQVGHVEAQVVHLARVLRPPNGLEQLTVLDRLAGVADEQFEQVPLGGGEPHRPGRAGDPPLGEIDGEGDGMDDRLLRAGRFLPAQLRFSTRVVNFLRRGFDHTG
jgi:hypothetical protein